MYAVARSSESSHEPQDLGTQYQFSGRALCMSKPTLRPKLGRTPGRRQILAAKPVLVSKVPLGLISIIVDTTREDSIGAAGRA